MPFGTSHEILLTVARWCLHGFYREIKTIGYENVPKEGPIIVSCSHCNMVVDVAILSATFPHKRKLHYWAKDSLFKNKYASAFLTSSGVVPVDRTTKNNKALFASTFEVLELGEVVGVFPEGTSHSESRLLALKDGTSWAALEYARLAKEESSGGKVREKAPICPVGITYVQKSKYRSVVIVTYGKPIDVGSYLDDFEKDQRATVKALTKRLVQEMEKLTVNSENWETLNAATISRQLLFNDDKNVAMEDYVKVTQSLVNFFANPISEEITFVKNQLSAYKTTLDSLHLTNADFSRYESRELTLHWAFYTLLADSCKLLIQLPFFLPGLLFHWPIYVLGKVSAHYEIYEECRAQNKIVLGLLWLVISYLTLFFVIWATMLFTPLGFILAGVSVFIFAWYHIALIDGHYNSLKDVISSYRILIALASGKGSEVQEKVENLSFTQRTCIEYLTKLEKEYQHKSQDLRYVFDYRESRIGNEEIDMQKIQ